MRLTNRRARRGPREAAPETAARALRTASAIFPVAVGTARPRAAAPTAEVIGAVCDSNGVVRDTVPVGELNGTRAPPGTLARPVLVQEAGRARAADYPGGREPVGIAEIVADVGDHGEIDAGGAQDRGDVRGGSTRLVALGVAEKRVVRVVAGNDDLATHVAQR